MADQHSSMASDSTDVAPDALTLLRTQHLEVETMFRELEQLQPMAQGSHEAYLDERRRRVELLIRKLMQHSGIEELHFYPALAEHAQGGDRLVREALEQHTTAEQELHALDGISPDNLDFDGHLRALIAGVRAHVRMEETEIFPRIEAALDERRLLELGEQLRKAMKKAPTRPHPHTPPATSAVGKVMAAGAAVTDRIRDAVDGRTRE